MNVRRAATFVVAIVPFHQVPVDFGPIAKAGQFAGPGHALKWDGEHLGKTQPAQPFCPFKEIERRLEPNQKRIRGISVERSKAFSGQMMECY
jgi:hypothetical protein